MLVPIDDSVDWMRELSQPNNAAHFRDQYMLNWEERP